ncbi:hypothetical protein SLA2020_097740 [Shorea laevis]
MAQVKPHHHPLSSVTSSFLTGGDGRYLPTVLTVKPPRKLADAKSRSVCRCSWQEVVGVLVFSAIPFTAVKAIANSPLGESLQRRLEEKKKVALQNSSKLRALSEKARNERYYSLLLFANPLNVCSKSKNCNIPKDRNLKI